MINDTDMSDFSGIMNAHPQFTEAMYNQYINDPSSVDATWAAFFSGFDFAINGNGKAAAMTASTSVGSGYSEKEVAVLSLIHGYRDRGHFLSTTNPIRERKDRQPHLKHLDYGLNDSDLDTVFQSGAEIGLPNATLRAIMDRLEKMYCEHIGFEYNHIQNRERRMWLRDKIETRDLNAYHFSDEKRKRIYDKVNSAVTLEKFLHTKFSTKKRFSLEGGEATIAALDAIINKGAEDRVEEVLIGMAHRGRVNTLVNVMGKPIEMLFSEFNEKFQKSKSFDGDGDVKYHMGYSSDIVAANNKVIKSKLAYNPSHLEAVNPVVGGFARAIIDQQYAGDNNKVLSIVIHGDAAAVGQGVVYEMVQMCNLPGYSTGGTIHFVINNQVGFTTDFEDARSSNYCTAAANMVQAPIFHVNGDDVEAVVWACELATEYRQKFNSEVFIDMVCYRFRGHNEGENPGNTQPLMYELIGNDRQTTHPNIRTIYGNQLVKEGVFTAPIPDNTNRTSDLVTELKKEKFWQEWEQKLDNWSEKTLLPKYQALDETWNKFKFNFDDKKLETSPKTGIQKSKIADFVARLSTAPASILDQNSGPYKNFQKLAEAGNMDWGFAELMAYASVLEEGKDIRFTGQDVKRGTFSHRFAVLKYIDETSGTKIEKEYNRLSNIADNQGVMRIYNSLLSEYAVLGFEYGYSLTNPNNLVIWEAQFGDFSNGCQTMIDQFISSGESKWQRQSGLVMLLPHGYEGQGPEHSSCRIERYLQLCGDNNMTVCNITSPANLFHVLRRQLARDYRKPLIIATPKSKLKVYSSPLTAIETGTAFQEVLDDVLAPKKVRKVIFCSGKVSEDIEARRRGALTNESGGGFDENIIAPTTDVALVRVEQLYPFPAEQVKAIMKKYKGAEYVWVQEEPENMGAWSYIAARHSDLGWSCVARRISASPAVGYVKVHVQEQKDLMERAVS